jgi:hypothetical protein
LDGIPEEPGSKRLVVSHRMVTVSTVEVASAEAKGDLDGARSRLVIEGKADSAGELEGRLVRDVGSLAGT